MIDQDIAGAEAEVEDIRDREIAVRPVDGASDRETGRVGKGQEDARRPVRA